MSFLAPIAGGLAAAGPLISLAGAGLSAYSKYQQGKQQAQIANYNARLAEQSAQLAEKKAAQQKAIGERRKRSYISKLRAAYSSRGVTLQGSPLLVMAESATALETDIQNEEYNSLIEASKYRSQAEIYGMEADYYKTSGTVGALTTLGGGIYKYVSTYK